MKKILSITIGLVFVISAIAILAIRTSARTSALAVPTAAPTATAGPATNSFGQSYSELAQPIKVEMQALDYALTFDSKLARWDQPWSKQTVTSAPERIKIEWHADRSYDGSYFGPGTETGPVWVVTIKGTVRINEDNFGVAYDGITYTIAQKTGNLLQFATGLPIK